jgi:dihydrofolate reductase
MRTIVNSSYISLDGVVDNVGDWPSTSGDDEERRFAIQLELLEASDILIMGRHTYEGFAPVWPTRSGDPASDHINSMRKYVFSTTLKDPEWNNTTVIDSDPVAAIRELKEQDGEGIVQYGYGPITHAMIANDLLDELRLWVHPLIAGKDGSIYAELPTTVFKLADVTAMNSGTVVLSYTR